MPNDKSDTTEDAMTAAAPDLLEALLNVRKLISEAAATGFNYKDGDWPERLYFSQQKTSAAIEKAKGMQKPDPLILAAIAVARSEAAVSTPLSGDPEGHAHEPWPEMDALRDALDAVQPGWRSDV